MQSAVLMVTVAGRSRMVCPQRGRSGSCSSSEGCRRRYRPALYMVVVVAFVVVGIDIVIVSEIVMAVGTRTLIIITAIIAMVV